MGLLGFGKKKKGTEDTSIQQEPVCACCSGAPTFEAAGACRGGKPCGITSIKVLGAGCKSCHEQYENCKAAVRELGMELEVEYITDMERVMSYGIMSMPGIVINDEVVSMGKVLKAADVVKLFQKLNYCCQEIHSKKAPASLK